MLGGALRQTGWRIYLCPPLKIGILEHSAMFPANVIEVFIFPFLNAHVKTRIRVFTGSPETMYKCIGNAFSPISVELFPSPAAAGASATIASDALVNPFDGISLQ